MYAIYKMSNDQVTFMRVGAEDTLPEAIDFARKYHGLTKPDVTLTVEVEGTRLPVVSFSTRRITGNFVKQMSGGRKGDDAIYCGEEDFDATMHVLSMSYKDAIRIKDNDDTSDEIGMAHVTWSGPHEVTLVDSMCDFFGVTKIAEISEGHFNFVVESRQQELQEYRAGMRGQQAAERVPSPSEAARDLIMSLARLTIPGEIGPDGKTRAPADGAAAQEQLTSLIRQSREIVARAEAQAQYETAADRHGAEDEEANAPRQ